MTELLAGSRRSERKLVSLLFADLAGYTPMTAALDLEDVHHLVGPLMDRLVALIRAGGGVVSEIQGDGFMAVFGVPAAHEDDAERAVRSALELVREASSRPHLPPVHAGVEAGEVLVSVPSAGAGFGVTGGAVTLAARLCALADPGTVLVGPRAFELSWRGIEFGAAGQRVVRGFPAPVTVRRALGVARHHPERGTAFLGRERELDRLRRLCAAVATDGAQRVAVVGGDPGIGKSRLADALVGELDGALAVWARCSPYPAGVPYAALVDGLLSAGVGSTDELADRAGLADVHVRRLLQGLGGASTGPDRGGAPGPGAGDALLLAIRGLARRQPVVVVVDDAEHADPDLRDLLAGLGRSPDGAVLWLILGPPPDLVLPGEHLHLPPLGEADSRRLLEHALPDGATGDLVSGLARRSAGNPLVLLECARAAREGAVGRGHLGSPTVLDPDAAVPLTVRGVLAAQLDRLPDEEKSAVQDMAVTSGSTWPDLLARLCPGTPAAELLAALRRRGLVRQAERPRLPTTPEYELRSPMLGEVAYASLPRAARVHKHAVAAAWLREQVARRPGSTVVLAQLAHHDERVWRYRRWAAAELAADAATRAVRSLADLADRLVPLSPRAAGEASARGLQIAAEAPEVDPALRAELELRRAQSLRESWELEEALAAARAAEAAVGRPDLRAEATLVRGDVLSWLGRVEKGRQVLSEARARFADLGDAAGQARALQRSAYTWRYGDLGRMAQVLEAAQRQLVDADEHAAAALVATDLAYIATERSAEEVARWCDTAVRLVSDPSDLRVRALLAWACGYGAYVVGNWRDGAALLEEARTLGLDAGVRWVELDALRVRAACLLALGRHDEARALLDRLLTGAGHAAESRQQALALLVGAQLSLQRGNVAGTRARIAESRRLLLEIGAREDLTDVLTAEAVVSMHLGDTGWLGRDVWPEVSRAVRALDEEGAVLLVVPLLAAEARYRLLRDPWEALGALRHARDRALAVGADGHRLPLELCLAQARLLTGERPERRTPAPATPESEALAAEVEALRALAGSDVAAARAALAEAVDHWRAHGDSVWAVRSLGWQARLAVARGDDGAARAAVTEASATRARLDTPVTLLQLVAPLDSADLTSRQAAPAPGERGTRWLDMLAQPGVS